MLTREVGDLRVGDGVDHLGAVLDDAALLVLLAHHVARGVLEEQQRHVDLVASWMNWVALLASSLNSTPRWLASTPIGIAVDRRPAGDQARPVERLELVEARPVDHPGQDVAGVEGDAQVGRGDARAARRGRGPARRPAATGPGPSLRQLSRDTMARPMRMASISSAAR